MCVLMPLLPRKLSISMIIVPPKVGNGKGMSTNSLDFVDFKLPISKSLGMLPHWDQCGKMQFVTCRLCDSLPPSRLESLEEEKRKIQSGEYLIRLDNEAGEIEKIDYYLSQGHGQCLLKYEPVQRIVDEALNYYDGKRYDLFDYVIMPNHVHFLVTPYEDIKKIWADFRRFTTARINKLFDRSGRLWQEECFDRMVRNGSDFQRIKEYIRTNPAGSQRQ